MGMDNAACTKDCPDTCGLLAKVEDGQITAVKGDPGHPFTRGGHLPQGRILSGACSPCPAHRGTEDLIDHDFIARRTIGFDELKTRAAAYPPETVAGICGLSADGVRELALAYGRARAPYIRTGLGAGAPAGGRHGHALTELGDPPIKYLHVYLSNPAAVAPQSHGVMAGLAREDLFVSVQGMFMADIIPPGASFLEVGDIYRAYGHNYIQLGEPVIAPVGQSRSTLAICQDLARRMGFADAVFSLTESECIDRLLADPSPYMTGVDIDRIRSGQAAPLNIPDNPYAGSFKTPSGKVEFFSQSWANKGLDPLPDGRPIRDPEGNARFPLEFITPPHRLFLNSAFNEIAALREAAGPPATALARGIADGDDVRVHNDRGDCYLMARITEDTRPGLLVAEGIHRPGRHRNGKGVNQITSQRLTDAGRTCAFHCNRVEVAASPEPG